MKTATLALAGDSSARQVIRRAISHEWAFRPARQWVASIPPLYPVAAAVLAGDAAGDGGFRVSLWAAATLAALSFALFCLRRCTAANVLAVIGIFAAAAGASSTVLESGSWRSDSLLHLPEGIPLLVEGTLYRDAEPYLGRTHLYLHAQSVRIGRDAPAAVSGNLRLTLLEPADFRQGQRLQARLSLRFPRNYGNPGEFDYQAYMAREGIAATAVLRSPDQVRIVDATRAFPASQIGDTRRAIGRFIDDNLTDPARSEMRALVIGDRGGISPSLREIFATTGMAHLLIISGLHMSLVASAAFALTWLALCKTRRLMVLGLVSKLAAIFAAIAVCAYALIAGHHVSTVRALIMVLCYAMAVASDRQREVLDSLVLAALIICLVIPGSSADIGFQLSFVSVLAIVLGMRRFESWWHRTTLVPRLGLTIDGLSARAAHTLGGYVAVSFFALLGTAPLTALYFNQVSMIGLIANAVVVPIMGLAGTVGGLLAAAMSFVWPWGAAWLLRAAGQCLVLGTWIASALARLPGAWWRIFTPSLFELVSIYLLLGLWLLPSRKGANRTVAELVGLRARPVRPRWHRWATATLLLALAFDAGLAIERRYFNPHLMITQLAVGQGDAAVVRFPGSKVMLIDGGGSFSEENDTGERILAPYLWYQRILHVDYLVVSHPELDHFGGLDYVARNFTPTEFWSTGAVGADIKYQQLLEDISRAGASTRLCDGSHGGAIVGSAVVTCLGPIPGALASQNDNSMVLMVGTGHWRFLFTGDLERQGEAMMVRMGKALKATVLKVPHHGSITSSSATFIDAVRPRFAVISVGYRNRYHFPAEEVVERYEAAGATVLRTDQLGAVTFEVGDLSMTVRAGERSKTLAAMLWPIEG